ncbi:hypothetical protein J6590_021144 [Homalodisca vitripennis]|nr:hypothetical protein J6590_021144 [Homalodisca vitripennis]
MGLRVRKVTRINKRQPFHPSHYNMELLRTTCTRSYRSERSNERLNNTGHTESGKLNQTEAGSAINGNFTEGKSEHLTTSCEPRVIHQCHDGAVSHTSLYSKCTVFGSITVRCRKSGYKQSLFRRVNSSVLIFAKIIYTSL